MDKFLENLPSILTFFGLYLTAVHGPKVLARIQGRQKKEEVKLEGDSNAEVMYVSNMSVILGEYKEQVSGFRNELESVRKEFAEFKKAHKKEVEEYKTSIVFLEREIEMRDDRIEELESEILEKNGIIATLKGEI
ncbi:hypothetical protein JTF06_12185 [Desemzia sp. RIT804]|uniref:hypothetical protein n=1 Tax=Desemzia sp. RIT 804 TaxID=2810209 RepID=UPI00194E8C42|nr:hypothetical protein [Desemzia sp. RIT 804]MBM6615645.1 hypothetical protein [Desemzia sp. RIT 804]